MGNSHDPATSTSGSAGESNLSDSQMNSEAKSQLVVGMRYKGVVIRVDVKNECYDVLLDKPRTVIPGCYYSCAPLAGILGFTLTGVIPRGTRVDIIYDNPAPIISTSASGNPDPGNLESRTSTGSDLPASEVYPEYEDSFFHTIKTKPADMLEGEWDLSNMLGVGIQFLTTMIKIQAGERAKVEACVLNDMVRIISGHYKNHSPLGDEEIYDDGTLNHVCYGAKFPHEAWGTDAPQSPKAEVEGREVEKDSVAKEMQRRWADFKGYLGDYVHSFVMDPEGNTKAAMEQLCPGKSLIWQAQDGSLVFQSVADISFERRIKVQIPIEKQKHYDPKGTPSTEKAQMKQDLEPLKNWDFGKDFKDAWQLGYQIREYARWLGEYHNYARFIQSGDWEVKSEKEAEKSAYTNRESDTEKANQELAGQEYLERYSTIRIFRDGSQLQYDGYGNMTLMSPGGIHHSSVSNYTVDAAGDIRMIAGGSFWLKARKHVDIVAQFGGLILKGRTWFRGLCEWGSIFLKSDAPDPDGGEAPKTKGDQPEDFDAEPDILDHAIVLDAPLGNIIAQAGRRIYIEASKGDAFDYTGDLNDEKGSVVIQSNKQDVQFRAKRVVRGRAEEEYVAFRGPNFIASADDGVLFRGSVLDFNRDVFSIRDSQLEVRSIRTNIIESVSLKGKSVQADNVYAGSVVGGSVGETDEGGPDIDDIEPEYATDEERNPRTTKWEQTTRHGFARTYPHSNQQPFWEFLDRKEYYPKKLIQEDGWRYNQAPGQKRIEDDALGEKENYFEWDWSDDRLDSLDSRTGGRAPFPWGSQDAWMTLSGSAMDPLEIANTKTPDQSLKQSKLRRRNVKFYAKKPT